MSLKITTLVQRHPLTIFFGASVGLSWLITLAIARIPTNPIILPLLAFPISYAPALMALIVLRVAGSAEQRHEFRQRLTTFRVGMRWYVVALWVLRQPRTELVPTPATT